MKSKYIALALAVLCGVLCAGKVDKKMSKRDFLIESYSPAYCQALALAYGDENMMSEGGSPELGLLLDNIDVTGKTVLDFGCGMGGNTFFFVQDYAAAQAIGIDINKEMLENATAQTPGDCKGKVIFQLSGEENSLPVADSSVDLIFEKGAICHLSLDERKELYKEFLRILKPGGEIVFMDIVPLNEGTWAPEVAAMEEAEALPIFAQTADSWSGALTAAGFSDVSYADISSRYVTYAKESADRLQQPQVKESFLKLLSKEEHAEHVAGYAGIATTLERGDTQIIRFYGRKSPVTSL